MVALSRRWRARALALVCLGTLALTGCDSLLKVILGNAAPSITSLDLTTPNPTAGSLVTVIATATDENGDSLDFTWILTAAPLGFAGSLSSSGSTVSFTPDRKGTYTIRCTVSDGSATDDMSVSVNVLSADSIPPTVVSVFPSSGATDVPVTTLASATFSEAMDPATITTASFRLFLGASPIAGSVSWDAGTRTATFDPSASLLSSSVYEARVTTAVTDTSENALALEYSWTFTTAAPDTTAPTVSSVSPASGATGVATGTTVSATFGEDMASASLTTTSFQVLVGGNPIDGAVSYNAGTRTATFDPTADLAGTTEYTARVTTAATDAAGNHLADLYSWTFTTAAALDTTPPTVTLVSPAEGATNVPITSVVAATFGEAMDAGTITTANFQLLINTSAVSGSVSYESGTRIATFTPTSNLASTTTYTGKVSTGVHDAADNALAQTFTWTFTTGDATPPGNVTTFTATPGDGQVTLSWTNPTGYADFAGVLVLWKTGGAPQNPTDGTVIFDGHVDGLGTACTHSGADNGTLYYYRAFSFDTADNYSSGLSTSATPQAPPEAPTGLIAIPGMSDVYLAWTPPANVDGVMVRSKLGSYPSSPTDGDQVYSGAAAECATTTLFYGNTYYFAAFAYRSGVYSPPATAIASPAFKQDVDLAGDVGRDSSIALDAAGKAYIAYYDYTNVNAKYATNKTGSWAIETIPDASSLVGQFTSIALDSGGYAHVCYYDASLYDLKYATNKSGSWEIASIDSANTVGLYNSLKVDAAGYAHIAYFYDTDDNLKYATNAPSGTWSTTTVDAATSTGYYAALALDAGGKAHISYIDRTSDDLMYATNASGDWTTMVLDAGQIDYHTSIVVDHAGKVHVSYYDSANYDLKYITNAGGGWAAGVIVDANKVGDCSSIAVDSANNAYIAYRDLTGGYYFLKVATNKGGSWHARHFNVVDAIGYYTSTAVDAQDNVHISCYLYNSTDLRYIRFKVE